MDNVAGNVPSLIVSFPACCAESEWSLIGNAAVCNRRSRCSDIRPLCKQISLLYFHTLQHCQRPPSTQLMPIQCSTYCNCLYVCSVSFQGPVNILLTTSDHVTRSDACQHMSAQRTVLSQVFSVQNCLYSGLV